MFLTTFRRFPTTFRRFPQIFQNCSEGLTNVSKHFRTFSEDFRRFQKVVEDFRGGTDDVSIIQHLTSEYLLSDYVALAMAILRLVTTASYFHV